MMIVILWFLLRVLTSLVAAIASAIKPITPLEMRINLLPPSTPIDLWFHRVLISPWTRWDVEWYEKIVAQGYSATDGTAQFHPLYPWLATPLSRIGITPVLSLLLISSLAGVSLLFFFQKLARLDLSPDEASFALILFAFTPIAFILYAPYSEALFLLFAVLCIYFARQKSWWISTLLGGLASLTRQQGIFLLILIAWELWEANNRDPHKIKGHLRDWLSLVMVPVGYLVWLIYRALILSDLQVNWRNFQEFIYSFMISPSASEVVQEQKFLWPWQALYLSFSKLFTQSDLDLWVDIIIGMIFLVLLSISWKKMRLSYRIYSAVITLISFCYYTGSVHPYMGLPRHLLLAFPIFIGLAGLIKKPWMLLLSIGLSAIGMSFLVVIYVINAWVP